MKNSNQYSEKKLPLYDAAFERLRSDMLTTYYDDFVVVENYIMHKSFVSQWELYDYKYDTDPNDPAYYAIDFDGTPDHVYEKDGTKVTSNTYTKIYASIRFITNPILLELFKKLLPVWNNALPTKRVEEIEKAYRLKILGEVKTDKAMTAKKKESTDNLDDQVLNNNTIENLKVRYVNDEEFTIQEPGKVEIPINFRIFGARNNETKEWTTFLEILKNPDHTYCCGISTVKAYSAKKKLLDRISNKLSEVFTKTLSWKIPEKFELFEDCRDKEAGTFQFKFNVEDNRRVMSELKMEKLKLLENLCRNSASEEDVVEAAKEAVACDATEKEVLDSLPDSYKEVLKNVT